MNKINFLDIIQKSSLIKSLLLISFFLFLILSSSNCFSVFDNFRLVDDWGWLDDYPSAKKHVLNNYSEMLRDYIIWREKAGISEPDGLKTMAAKARIIFMDKDGHFRCVLEANHGRKTLLANGKLKDTYKESQLNETVFLAGEEKTYQTSLSDEKGRLKKAFPLFDKIDSLSWHSLEFTRSREEYNLYYKLHQEHINYTSLIDERKRNLPQFLRRLSDTLTKDFFNRNDETKPDKTKGEINQVYNYRDLHIHDGEAFVVDTLLNQLNEISIEFESQEFTAFVLFFTERDPCLSCSVTIRDYLSKRLLGGFCKKVIPISMSLDVYHERKYDETETHISVRELLLNQPDGISYNPPITETEDDDEDDDAVAKTTEEQSILHLYRIPYPEGYEKPIQKASYLKDIVEIGI